VRRLVDGRAQSIEVGDAVLILDDDLAIDDGCLAGELPQSFDHPVVGSGPVPAMSGESLTLALVDDEQGAIAVVLDLVKSSPLRRVVPARVWGFPA
jgi:hypothetical protein